MNVSTDSALRFAFLAIYITQDDSPEDRQIWWGASEAAQAQAEREVRASFQQAPGLTRGEALGQGRERG